MNETTLHVCRECGQETADVYFRNGKTGQPTNDPYCAACFEDAMRRAERERYNFEAESRRDRE